ncbi:MAG: hypothetical protein HFJ27_03250 [Clostridia bacterium]|nr:hypothetical protein [Clostridia bacterium]
MDIEKIKKANTKIIGKEIIYFDELASTQKEAKRRIKENKPVNGTIILTNHQTQGIGTKGRNWYTKNGQNITMTIVCYPNCDIRKTRRTYHKDSNSYTGSYERTIWYNLTNKRAK